MGSGLKLLQIGQSIQIQHLEFGCNLRVLPSAETGPKVVELGVDYVVVDDVAEGIQTRIPMHVIRLVAAESAPPVAVLAGEPEQPIVEPAVVESMPSAA